MSVLRERLKPASELKSVGYYSECVRGGQKIAWRRISDLFGQPSATFCKYKAYINELYEAPLTSYAGRRHNMLPSPAR